jgi:hypothetical protein
MEAWQADRVPRNAWVRRVRADVLPRRTVDRLPLVGVGPFYVRPFPGPGGQWRVSTDGGQFAIWSRARPEIVYQNLDNRLMVASYTVEGDTFKVDKPRLWSERRLMPRSRLRSFTLHPDGERVVLAVAPDADSAVKQDTLVFIFNFFDELRRIAPEDTSR